MRPKLAWARAHSGFYLTCPLNTDAPQLNGRDHLWPDAWDRIPSLPIASH